ncbi:MAG: sulfite exporter TauE/SafE family protein [Oceanicaulis sp.]
MTHPGMELAPTFGGRIELDMLAGLIAGFSSSIHCLAMCGGVAAAIALRTGPAGAPAWRAGLGRARVVTEASLSRIAVYAALGALAGSLGWGLAEAGPAAAVRDASRYLAALVLAAAAVTVLDIPLFGGRLGALTARASAPLTRRLHHLHRFGAAGLGVAWGLTPCAMVYLATFYAGLTGSAGQGALVMVGFGIGTAPALIALGAGAGALPAFARSGRVKLAAAAALIALALATAAGVTT